MSGRHQRNKDRQPSNRAFQSTPLSYNPFRALKGLKPKAKEPPPPAEPPIKQPSPESDSELFRSAMADVTPLSRKKSRVAGASPQYRRPESGDFYSEDLEALAQLEDLVAGRTQFDLVDTDEYLEGYVRGIHPIILEKLRQGGFSVQAHIDLHGLTVPEADEAVRDFISEALLLGYRCVLLIHGRGLNSKDNIPVLKRKLETILRRGPVRKHILAFTSARPHDGGAGATYVLLRARK